jgi:hypothetical protein
MVIWVWMGLAKGPTEPGWFVCECISNGVNGCVQLQFLCMNSIMNVSVAEH